MNWQHHEGIPDGWTARPLADITKVIGGGTPKTTVPGNFADDEGHPWITPSDLTGYRERYIARGRRFLTDQGLKTSSATYMPAGTVLFSSRAPIGYVAIASEPVTTNQGFRSFLPSEEVDPEYLYHALRLLRPLAEHLASGTTFAELSGTKAGRMVLAYPPREQQRQIVALLDSADAHRDTAATNLARARQILSDFRQAVLAAATAGRLTEDWRKANDCEPVLRALTEARKRQRTSKLPRDRVSTPDTDELRDLPEAWAWARVGEVGSVQLGGTPSRKVPEYWGPSVPWVSSGEVANCRISETRETITDAGLANSNAKLYPAGTVLVAMIGEGKTRGQAAILDTPAATNQNAAGIVPNRGLVDPEYLWRWALAHYEITRAVGRGGNQPALNGQKVKELVLPVPPLDEQNEIVRRVDALLSGCDQVREQIEHAAKLLDRAGQTALEKAFRGELNAGERP